MKKRKVGKKKEKINEKKGKVGKKMKNCKKKKRKNFKKKREKCTVDYCCDSQYIWVWKNNNFPIPFSFMYNIHSRNTLILGILANKPRQ